MLLELPCRTSLLQQVGQLRAAGLKAKVATVFQWEEALKRTQHVKHVPVAFFLLHPLLSKQEKASL